jgi:hypothetical protein
MKLYPITEDWDVPLMVTRGYSSLSCLHPGFNVAARRAG